MATPDATKEITSQQTNFDKTVQTLIQTRLEELLRAPLVYLTPGNFITARMVKGSNATMRYLAIPDIDVDDAELAASLVVTEGEPNDSVGLDFQYEEFATRQRMKTIKITDVADLESPEDLPAIAAERLARWVMAVSDRIAANVIGAGGNTIWSDASDPQTNNSTGSVTADDVLVSRDIKRAVALLEGGSVPRFGGDTYRGELHPYVKFDVELDDDAGGWIDASRYAGSTQLFTGELGKYAGVRFMSTPNATVFAGDGSGSIDVYSTSIHGPDFFALGDFGAGQTFVTPPGGHDDPGHQSALITWKGWLDAALVGEMGDANGGDADPDPNTDVGPRYIRIESASSL